MTNWVRVPYSSQSTNLVVNGDFNGDVPWQYTDWIVGNGEATHVPPDSTDLAQNITVATEVGDTFIVQFTVSGMTVGLLEVRLDVDAEQFEVTESGTYTHTFTSESAIGDVNLIFTDAMGNFDGAIQAVSMTMPVPTSWTSIAEPSGVSSVSTGYAYGLLMAITRPETITSDTWTRIGEPSTMWTSILSAA